MVEGIFEDHMMTSFCLLALVKKAFPINIEEIQRHTSR